MPKISSSYLIGALLVSLCMISTQADLSLKIPTHKYLMHSPKQAVKNLFLQQQSALQTAQPTVFTECPSEGLFKISFTDTYSEPRQPVKSASVTLDVAGTFTDDVSL